MSWWCLWQYGGIPQVTLLSAEPEIQYVALRNINLIVQKRPDILKQEMKVALSFRQRPLAVLPEGSSLFAGFLREI